MIYSIMYNKGENIMEEKIIQEYLAGKSINQLSKEYPVTYNKIKKILKEHQIVIRGGRKKKILTQEQKIILLQEFKTGKSKKDIAKKIKVDVTVVNRFIDENDLIRSRNRINKNIKSDYFSNIDSAEKAYWLGFLFTDGSVDHSHTTGRVRLQLQEQDLQILEKYKQDLGIDSKIIYDRRPNSTCCSVEFVDEQIYQDLIHFGIIPNKTYECHHIPYEKIPKKFLNNFILGLYDGDGGLSCSKDFSTDVTLCFTSYYKSIVEDFQFLIDNYILNKNNHTKNFYTSAWHTQWRGRLQVLKILDIINNKRNRYLNRKYQKYLQLKKSLN